MPTDYDLPPNLAGPVYTIPPSNELPAIPDPDEPPAATFLRLIGAGLQPGALRRIHYSPVYTYGTIVTRSPHDEHRVATLRWQRDTLVFELDGYGKPMPWQLCEVPGLPETIYQLHTPTGDLATAVGHGAPAAYADWITSAIAYELVHFNFRDCAGCGWPQPYVRERDQLCRGCRGANRDPNFPRTPAARRAYIRRMRADAAEQALRDRGVMTLLDLLADLDDGDQP